MSDTIVGGLRARLIKKSFNDHVEGGLRELGWFNPNRKHRPVTIIEAPKDWNEEVPFNSVAVSAEDVSDEDIELGSALTEDAWTYYVDVYAESEAVGESLAYDVRDILRGKMPSIGYGRQSFPVLDYRLATPVPVFRCGIENVVVDRARNFPQAWRQFWFSIRCDVNDEYVDDLSPEVVEV